MISQKCKGLISSSQETKRNLGLWRLGSRAKAQKQYILSHCNKQEWHFYEIKVKRGKKYTCKPRSRAEFPIWSPDSKFKILIWLDRLWWKILLFWSLSYYPETYWIWFSTLKSSKCNFRNYQTERQQKWLFGCSFEMCNLCNTNLAQFKH